MTVFFCVLYWLEVNNIQIINKSNPVFSSLQLSVFDSEGRGQSWPRLIHTANSSQVKVWLDGILPQSNNSRFMLELEAVGGAYPLSRVDVRQSIDDEYTPSIFKVINTYQ